MIKSVSATPVYNEWENHVSKKLTGFGIFIECGIKDADEIFNLVKKMTKCPHSTESEEEVHPEEEHPEEEEHPSCKLYGIDIIKDKGDVNDD
jgi:hypothetical protein